MFTKILIFLLFSLFVINFIIIFATHLGNKIRTNLRKLSAKIINKNNEENDIQERYKGHGKKIRP